MTTVTLPSTLNFPLNPSIGQTYSLGGLTWRWNGYAWAKLSPALIEAGGGISLSVNTTTGATVVNNTATLQSLTANGSTTTSVLTVANTSNSVSTTTGAIVVSGGVGVGGDIWANNIHAISTANSVSTDTGAVVVSGGVGVGGDVWVYGRINSESVKISDSIMDSASVSINTTATTIVDSYSILQFRSAKYLIQIDEGDGPAANFQLIELLLLVDNVGTVYATEYGVLTSHGDMGNFAAEVDVDNMLNLYFTPTFATTKVLKLLRTGITL